MTKTLEAIYDGEVLRPDEPIGATDRGLVSARTADDHFRQAGFRALLKEGWF